MVSFAEHLQVLNKITHHLQANSIRLKYIFDFKSLATQHSPPRLSSLYLVVNFSPFIIKFSIFHHFPFIIKLFALVFTKFPVVTKKNYVSFSFVFGSLQLF